MEKTEGKALELYEGKMTMAPPTFNGVENWNLLRNQWKSKKANTPKQPPKPINPDILYEELFSTNEKGTGTLSQKVALPELVSVLVEGITNSRATQYQRFIVAFNNLWL